ncbi:hypothetical protein I5R16_09680 [Serratia marcescens]|nr:hypothetical protein [Serratia marcescens]
MTLTTKEELKHLASSDNTNELTRRLAREYLANREALPVMYASEETLAYAKEGEKSLVTWSEPMGDAVIPLYTAPPAPAVPDAIITAPIEAMRCGPAASYVLGWNACRAAMLAQPVSSGYKLPPHVYRELVNSLRDTAVKFSGTEQLRERLNTALSQFIEPDHPHTRTVAPEGGNDHDTRR